MSDYIYPVLMDTDPAQLVDDEFKNRHNQLFCWRMLRQVALVDLTTFSQQKPNSTLAAPETATSAANQPSVGSAVFEGNIEEQARILCKSHMKKEILDQLPKDEDEVDEEGMDKDDEDNVEREADQNGLGFENGTDEDAKMEDQEASADKKVNGDCNGMA